MAEKSKKLKAGALNPVKTIKSKEKIIAARKTLWDMWWNASFRHQRLKQLRLIFALREPSSMFRAKTKNGIARICRRERLGFSEKMRLSWLFWVMWPPCDGF